MKRVWSGMMRRRESSEAYWTRHNVTLHKTFQSREESFDYIDWRNRQHPYYLDHMPVDRGGGKVVLDYGCGPGHDLIGFATAPSPPARLIGMDVSATSLAESQARLALHGATGEIVKIDEGATQLPLPDASVDIIHSSGVLHHTPDPENILREFCRILKPDGYAQIMVYNYDSLWLHLYVAYQRMLVEGLYAGKTLREAFTASTDGPNCPISECYKPEEFLGMATRSGLTGTLRGVAMSAWEMKCFAQRWDALLEWRLPAESRRFLSELILDNRGIPLWRGQVAGVDACFEVRRMA
ncbi:MAG: methyltransferase domain-containing protein [Alphaproteobacteria bacterium]